MKIERIREALHAKPFRRFEIHLADGGRIPVEHEDFVALEPAGREFSVYLPDGTHQIMDVMLVTRLELTPRNGVHPRKKR